MSKKNNYSVITPKFRVSWPKVFKPEAFKEGDDPKYSIVMIFDKDTDLSALKAAAKRAVEERWPEPAKRPKNLKSPFRDGNTEKPDLDSFQDKIFVSASSKKRPGLVDQNVEDIISDEDFYGGCYARASVNAFAYDFMGNRGVAFGLNNIQKLEDGEPFSGRARPEEEFEAVGETAAAATGTTNEADSWLA